MEDTVYKWVCRPVYTQIAFLHRPENGIAHSGLDPPMSVKNQNKPHRQAHRLPLLYQERIKINFMSMPTGQSDVGNSTADILLG